MAGLPVPPGLPFLPAAPPPPGVIPNYTNPEYIGGRAIAIASVFLGFALIFFAIRMFTRLRVVRAFGLDDAALVFCMVFTIVFSATVIAHTRHGLGKHIWEVPLSTFSPGFLKVGDALTAIRQAECLDALLEPANEVHGGQFQYLDALFYAFAIWGLKLSIPLLYLRLSPVKTFRLISYFMIFCQCCFGFGGISALLATCIPLAKAWDITITEGRCINVTKLLISNAYYNIFSDFILLVLPLPMVWNLQMPLRQKLGVTAIFSTGAFCVAMSIVRLVELLPQLRSNDSTWNVTNGSLWSILELDVGIICTSLATMQPFLTRYAPSLLGQSRKGSSNPDGYKAGSSYYWPRGSGRSGPSHGSSTTQPDGMSSVNGVKGSGGDIESLELGDGPRAETTVSGPGHASLAHHELAPHSSAHPLVSSASPPGIVKTSEVEVRDSDRQYLGRATR